MVWPTDVVADDAELVHLEDDNREWAGMASGLMGKRDFSRAVEMTDEIATGAVHISNNKEFLIYCAWKWIPDPASAQRLRRDKYKHSGMTNINDKYLRECGV